jgi:hypothetical protein
MANEIDRENELPRKPETRHFKDTSQRLRRGKEKPLSHRASLDWRLDQRRVCSPGGAEADIVPIAELCTLIRKSRTGEALLDGAKDVSILYDNQNPASQYYVRDGKRIITLNPLRPRGDLVGLLVRELRRDWQHHHGALVNPLAYEPDEAILVNRAQTADVLMIAVKAAWELKLVGEPEAWDFLVGSPLSDVTRTFEIKAQADFRTLNNGEASRAAYDKFFEDARTKLHDKRIIHQMLLDESGYMKAGIKRPQLSIDLFKRLGELPHGRNYLGIKAKHAPNDMCYSTVEDRSNANFLWFIKFERSFQEKELQMVRDSVKLSAEVVDFGKWSDKARRTRSSEPGQ